MQDRSLLTIATALIVLAGLLPVTVFAYTVTEHQVTDTTSEVLACTHEQGTLTVTYNQIAHYSTDNSGGTHGTFTRIGSFTFVQDNGVTYTGTFTVWDGNNSINDGTQVVTYASSIHGIGSDGSIINGRSISHQTINAVGDIPSMFADMVCY